MLKEMDGYWFNNHDVGNIREGCWSDIDFLLAGGGMVLGACAVKLVVDSKSSEPAHWRLQILWSVAHQLSRGGIILS